MNKNTTALSHHKKTPSLTLRLLLFVGLATVAIFLGFGWYIESTADEHFLQQDHNELQTTAQTLQKTIQSTQNKEELLNRLILIMSSHPDVFAYIENASGENYFINLQHSNIQALISKQKQQGLQSIQTLQTWQQGSNHYRVLVNHMKEKQQNLITVIVGMDINFHQHYLKTFRQNLWIGALVACILMIILSYLLVKKGLKPIQTISHNIQSITTEHLNTRLNDKAAPSELRSLIHSFNTMLEDIEDVFKRQSQFSADIAHELRTPISSLMMQTQIMLSKPRSTEMYQDTLYTNLEELERLSKMINDMLFLSKTTKGQTPLNVVTIDLAEELHALIEYFEPLAEDAEVHFLQKGAATPITGDKLMLQRALSNLLSNAIKYAKKHTTILITLSEQENDSCITLRNVMEKPLSQEQLCHIFDRFYRADTARERKNNGTGIGLSIVKSIIDMHQGKIQVQMEDGNIIFTLKLKKQLPSV